MPKSLENKGLYRCFGEYFSMSIVQMTQEELEQKCARQEQQIAELVAKLTWYEELYRLNKKKQFGPSSEQTNVLQLSVFNEAEVEAKPTPEPTVEQITYTRRKQQGKREEQLEDLPVEVVEYNLPEGQVCSCCGNELHVMSTETRQELKIIPVQVKLVKHVRNVYSCRRCEEESIKTPVVTAPMPAPVLPGSLASPSAIAYVMSQKYVESMPLYRQEQHLARFGIPLSRQTLANWMIQSAERWLRHLYARMHTHILKQDILHADETSLQVLHEEGREASNSSFMWLYRTGRGGPPIVLYDYQTTRASKHPVKFLSGFKGYIHVDGYAGYHALTDVTLVGCVAHARRKFTEALAALPKGSTAVVEAQTGLDYCNKLFAIEREVAGQSPQERFKYRQAHSRPTLESFSAWLKYQAPRVLPKSSFGQAIAYCRNQWDKLTAFLQDGRLELDNNRGERSIKPFVIGRKNWLFCNTPKGAKASATIYSIVETAKENDLNPFLYLQFLFEHWNFIKH